MPYSLVPPGSPEFHAGVKSGVLSVPLDAAILDPSTNPVILVLPDPFFLSQPDQEETKSDLSESNFQCLR